MEDSTFVALRVGLKAPPRVECKSLACVKSRMRLACDSMGRKPRGSRYFSHTNPSGDERAHPRGFGRSAQLLLIRRRE
jgi:hypothetical protein